MEKEKFSLFNAREVAENYVSNMLEKTNMVSAVYHVAVDSSYRCLSVPDAGNVRKLAEQQSVCIFRVRYNYGRAIVNETEYISDKLL